MENLNELKVVEDVSLETPFDELEERLLTETDMDKLNNVINIFNLNIKRKDMVRTSKLNELQDKITDQMAVRLTKNAGEFSNKDLLDYFKVVQDTINKSDNSLDSIDTPSITINQQQVNINTETELSRESRERVKDVVAKILANANYDMDMTNIIEIDAGKTDE